MNVEEKVQKILSEAMRYQLPEIKKAEKDFSECHQRIRTMLRNMSDKSRARQLEKQLDRVMDQMLELFGSLYTFP